MKNKNEKKKEAENKKVKKEGKRIDKGLVTIISISVAFALAIILAVVLPEPLMAAVQLKKTRQNIGADTQWSVSVTDPMRSGDDPLLSASRLLEGEEAKTIAEEINYLLKNVKYSGTDNVSVGVWKIKIVLYNTTEEQILYIDNDGLYIENDGKLFSYAPKKDTGERFGAFRSTIDALLDGKE